MGNIKFYKSETHKCYEKDGKLYFCENLLGELIKDDSTLKPFIRESSGDVVGVTINDSMITFCPFCRQIVFLLNKDGEFYEEDFI